MQRRQQWLLPAGVGRLSTNPPQAQRHLVLQCSACFTRGSTWCLQHDNASRCRALRVQQCQQAVDAAAASSPDGGIHSSAVQCAPPSPQRLYPTWDISSGDELLSSQPFVCQYVPSAARQPPPTSCIQPAQSFSSASVPVIHVKDCVWYSAIW